ncbi:hypothetical protein HK102_009111 [Quaeritorhiza haematococci]|nr:hypothetical protein HK102_009111 [Quaeritorhiza haematococci]
MAIEAQSRFIRPVCSIAGGRRSPRRSAVEALQDPRGDPKDPGTCAERGGRVGRSAIEVRGWTMSKRPPRRS